MNRIVSSNTRFFTMLIILAVIVTILVSYNYLSIRNAKEVESIDSLSGQRIGTCVGWETDYLLTPREDITLLRYDTYSDCLLALSCRQIDALGIDDVTATSVLNRTTRIGSCG